VFQCGWVHISNRLVAIIGGKSPTLLQIPNEFVRIFESQSAVRASSHRLHICNLACGESALR
jgi:hypothetical protein